MTRAKETQPGSGQIPEYKSPPSRINISLRKAYDNLRCRMEKKSNLVNSLRGNKRDLESSRQQWKEKAETLEKELNKKQKEILTGQKCIKELEAQIKKNRASYNT